MDYFLLLNQFYTYFVLIAIGYAASKGGLIHRMNSSFLSGFIMNVTFPLLIFTTFTNLHINAEMVKNLLFVFVCTYIALGLLLLAGKISGQQLSLCEHKYRIHVMHHMFGNVVFIGFPFIGSLFPGGEGILYASVFQLAGDSILWSYGIIFLRNKPDTNMRESLKHLVNINTITFIVSIICLAIGFKLPVVIEKPFASVGHLTLVLALIYVGYILSNIKLNHLLNERAVFAMTFNKLMLVPFIMLIILAFLQWLMPFVSNTAITVIVLQTGMPAMATVAILARKYRSDENLAGKNIFISTVFSIFTLPLLLYIINIVLNRA